MGDSDTNTETECARVAPQIPVNKLLTFNCEKDVNVARNVFNTEAEEEFKGTRGNYVKIESNT